MPADVADNVGQVLVRPREARYDLVLLEVQMPAMNGLEAVRSIRRHERAYRAA